MAFDHCLGTMCRLTPGTVQVSHASRWPKTRVCVAAWPLPYLSAVRAPAGEGLPAATGRRALFRYAEDAGTMMGVDVQQLRSAYERFFEFAEHGGFKQPARGEWSAPEIVAHVAFNDVLLADLTETLAEGGDPTYDRTAYENPSTSDAAALDRLVAGRSYSEILLLARENAARLIDAAARLDEQAAARHVPSGIAHAGEPILDETVPWSYILRMQAQRHLPQHTEQLEALCV